MRKKIKLSLGMLIFWFGVSAQSTKPKSLLPTSYINRIKAIPVKEKISSGIELIGKNEARISSVAKSPQMRITQAISEATIGNTTYDLQTNASISNRLLNHSDGTLSAVWNLIPPGGASSSRGTGYNYFDGSNWAPVPTARIEIGDRTNFTNIVSTASNREMAIAHSSTVPGILITARPIKGQGPWAPFPASLGIVANDTWSKAISGGTNGETVHVICNGSGTSGNKVFGQNGPLLYSRSIDGGITFPILRSVIPAIDSTQYLGFGGDAYSIDSKGDTVAIVVGDFANDLILLKSTDNGTTWSKTIVQTFPIPMYNDAVDSLPDLNGDNHSDTIEAPSGDAHVMIDNTGLVHVFWSNILISDTSAGDVLNYFPNGMDGGILYWNENHAAGAIDVIAQAQDLNGDGTLTISNGSGGCGPIGIYRGSITEKPSSGIDAANNLYVSYQTLCENCDTMSFGMSHKHVYVKTSNDNGQSWSCPVDIDQSSDALNEECVFACMAKRVTNSLHLIYQRDAAPGHSLLTGSGSLSCNIVSWHSNPSDIIYSSISNIGLIPWPGFCGGISVKENQANNLSFEIHPNPTNNATTITYSLNELTDVHLEVKNVLGKIVYTEDNKNLGIGKHHINLNTAQFTDGVYFYTLKAGNQASSRKFVVNHN